MADELRELISRYGLDMHAGSKRSLYSIYSKSRSEAVDLLALLGAHNAVLHLQSDAVVRELRESVNRRVNSETANLAKIVGAAQRQLRDIHLIESGMGLGHLPGSLQEVAEARLRYPEASLQELGSNLEPPLSKSAVYHRMIRIRRIAAGL
jgi:hypothetical protein